MFSGDPISSVSITGVRCCTNRDDIGNAGAVLPHGSEQPSVLPASDLVGEYKGANAPFTVCHKFLRYSPPTAYSALVI
jgi:hypothetical protein